MICFEKGRLRSLEEDNYAQLEQVPVDAVYAYFEAKHTLHLTGDGGQSLTKSLEQVARVKALCGTRPKVPLSLLASLNFDLGNIFQVNAPPGFPDLRNPLFAGVLARWLRETPASPVITDPQAAADLLARGMGHRDPSADMMVLGSDLMALPVLENEQGRPVLVSPFYVDHRWRLGLHPCRGMAFGGGLSLLLWALDFIELGRVQWHAVMSEGLGLTREPPPAQ